jgi:alpha(1,3/1,4) fucosyltransferase
LLIGIWNFHEELNYNNYMLLNSNSLIGDDLLSSLNYLYKESLSIGIEFKTLDMIGLNEKIDAYLFLDYPRMSNKYVKKAFKTAIPKYLIIYESEIIRPENWIKSNHDKFSKIFTWDDNLVDNKKFFKNNFSFNLPSDINKNLDKKVKLCTLIAGNKKVNHSNELYSERVKAINWFLKEHPQDFDLYGIGWNDYKFSGPKIIRALNRIKPLTRLLSRRVYFYKGPVDSKKSVLEKYKFAICYENAKGYSGYISEKIFDCFFSGCIPIYWGADNIEDHIPKGCFIDKREFENYNDIYSYIDSMSDESILQYLNNIELFLNSELAYMFSSVRFQKLLMREVCGI